MPYPNDNRLNVVLMQTSASADGSGKFPFTERIISGSNLFILTDANGNLTGSTSANFVGPVTMSSALSASGGIITSTISVSSNVYVSGSLTVVGNIVGTIDSASAILITDTPTTAATYYATFVDGTSGVRSLRTDSSALTWNPNTDKIQIGSGGVGNLEVAPQGGGAALKAYATNTTLASLEVGGGSYESASFFVNAVGEFQIKAGSYPDASVSSSLPFKLTSATQATSWNNGALSVNGGVGIGKNLYVSGSFSVVDASTFSGLVSASAGLTASAIQDAGTLTVVGNSILSTVFATNVTASNISASGNIIGNNGTFAGDVAVNGGDITTTVTGTATLFNTNATSVSIGGGATGQVLLGNSAGTVKSAGDFIAGTNIIKDGSGGVAVTVTSTLTTVAGDLQVNGNDIKDSNGTNNLTLSNTTVNVPLTTQATDWNNGALTVAGGVGIGKNLYASGSTFLYGDLTIFGVGSAGNTVNIGLNSTDTASLKVANNAFRVINGTGAGFDKVFTTLPISASNKVLFSNTTQATDWTTGALNVVGGVGIGKNLYVSGSTFLYGDLTIYGTGSVVNISSSTVIIGDNRIQLNAGVPIQRYAGIDVFDSGSGTFTNNVTSSLLWDGLNDNWLLVSNNQLTGSPLTQSSAIMIGGPTGSFGNESLLTVNYIPKAQSTGKNLQNSSLQDDNTTLTYTGTTISASNIITSNLTVYYTGSITYATGVYITYTTGSFTTLTITTGSSPGLGAQVPTNPTASGMPGQINVDNNFIYVYTNQVWKRVPLSTWTA